MTADGYTKEGNWPVTLDLTADQVQMLIRSIRAAQLFSGSGKNSSGQKQDTMEIIAYREFLKKIIEMLERAITEQNPLAGV